MNVYTCWYRGIPGYCCRRHNSRWMFVPDLGTLCNEIYFHVSLKELDFDNPRAKSHEMQFEKQNSLYQTLKEIIFSLFIPRTKAATVGGLLFARMA